MAKNKKDLVGKGKKTTIRVDPTTLKLVFRAAQARVSYLVEHDMMLTGGMCVETEEFVAALKEFKKAM